jgi:hypothetical protein
MGKSLIDETFDVYMQMRLGGKEAKAALEALRFRIQIMPNGEQAELVRRVKAWEGQHMGTAPAKPQPIAPPKPTTLPSQKPSSLPSKPPPSNSPKPPASSAAKPPITNSMMPPSSSELENPPPKTPASAPASAPAANANTVICTRCGKANNTTDVFCANCGNFLRTDQATYETTRLDDPDMISHGADFFGPDSTLVLVVDGTSYSYKVQPQRYKHETIIGRSEGSTMKPDIDLSAHNAAEMGVSRLHVALQYNAKNHLLSVSDMKSANGTFINGQKLYPQEVRVLRDGDELRLGRLLLHVYFQHGDRKG